MGIPATSTVSGAPPAGDQANAAVIGAFTGNGQSAFFPFWGMFNVAVWGTFSATITLTKSFDGGTTFIPVQLGAGSQVAISFTAPGSLLVFEPEQGVLYQFSCAFTSGTANYRMSATGGGARAWVPIV